MSEKEVEELAGRGGLLKVNADVIAMTLSEAGVVGASYLAVKIANELDPPNDPRWDAYQAQRLYRALNPQDPLTHHALRMHDMCVAAFDAGKCDNLICGHHKSNLIRSVESDNSFCEVCELRKQRNDAEHMEETLGAKVRELEQTRSDLAGLVKRLVYRHSKQLPLDEALTLAADYLTRKNLNGSILREEPHA